MGATARGAPGARCRGQDHGRRLLDGEVCVAAEVPTLRDVELGAGAWFVLAERGTGRHRLLLTVRP